MTGCYFDIWAPAQESSKWENVAFSAYAKHTQELDDVVDEIVTRYNHGYYDQTILTDDNLSQSDVDYIVEKVQQRIG